MSEEVDVDLQGIKITDARNVLPAIGLNWYSILAWPKR